MKSYLVIEAVWTALVVTVLTGALLVASVA